jgi:hypothetical protein
MKRRAFKEQINKILQALEHCRQTQLIEPSLILLYSGIDIMASLDRATNHNYVTRNDFCNWVNTYLLSTCDIHCTDLELYAARCGVVHSYSPRSRLSDIGEVRQIAYSHGSGSVEKLQKALDIGGHSLKIVAINLDDLIEAFKKAIIKFLKELPIESERENIFLERADKFFYTISLTDLEAYLGSR